MKALKIIGWTLLGLVLTVVAVACIAMYIIFTPERLTPVVKYSQIRARSITLTDMTDSGLSRLISTSESE